ncbi:GAF domain-containing protein [Roseivivax sp. CAU 1753]
MADNERALKLGHPMGGLDHRDRRRDDTFADSLADILFDSTQDCVQILDLDGTLRRINSHGCLSLVVCDAAAVVGSNYFDIWADHDRDLARAAAQAAMTRGTGRFTASYVSPSGRVSVRDETLTAMRSAQGVPEGIVVVSRDLTMLNRQLAKNRALADLGTLALTETDFDTVLQAVTDRLCKMFDCRFAKVLQFVDARDCLLLRVGSGWHTGLAGRAMVGIDLESQAGYTLRVNGPVVVRDMATDPRFSGPLVLRQHKVRSGMSTIIPGSGAQPFGVLGVHSDSLREFDQSDVDVLTALANIIAARWRQELLWDHTAPRARI